MVGRVTAGHISMTDTVFVSRLTADVPSHIRDGHVHRVGTEFAPVRREGEGLWEIEIRVPEGDGFWYETLVVETDKTEVVEVPQPE